MDATTYRTIQHNYRAELDGPLKFYRVPAKDITVGTITSVYPHLADMSFRKAIAVTHPSPVTTQVTYQLACGETETYSYRNGTSEIVTHTR